MRNLIVLIIAASISACTVAPKLDVGVLNDQVGSLKGESAKGYVDLRVLKCDELWLFKCDLGYFHLSGLMTGPPFNNGDEGAIEGPYFNITIFEL